MKIKFTKLPTTDEIIKISLDGGQSFTDYNVADVHESGIPLGDNQDYEKIQVKAPANVLKNLNVVSSVKVENTEGSGAGSTNESSFIIDTDTYGFDFPKCVTGVILPNGATTIGRNVLFKGFPNLKTIVIPDSVTSIAYSAFSGCSSLTSITIPEGVTSINYNTFQNCSSLTSVTIPNSVTSISDFAFQNCSSLKTINYTGTEEQWKAINKGSNWKYGCPSDMVINYNYTGE